MKQETIENLSTWGLLAVVIFMLYLLSLTLNTEYNDCTTDVELKETFWENTTCTNRYNERFECDKINITKRDNYCEETYGGFWVWEK